MIKANTASIPLTQICNTSATKRRHQQTNSPSVNSQTNQLADGTICRLINSATHF